jgi:hypothetical protein
VANRCPAVPRCRWRCCAPATTNRPPDDLGAGASVLRGTARADDERGADAPRGRSCPTRTPCSS